jgi:formylglycine-generating enzyme
MGAVRSTASLVVMVSTVVVTLAACASRTESGPGAEGPPRPRLNAAEPTGPRIAALVNGAPAPVKTSDTPAVPANAAVADAPPPATCPDANMVLVEGDYCTEVRQTCAEWMESPSNPAARCARFEPSVCIGERVHMRFCIDRNEYAKPGEDKAQADTSWDIAKATCESEGKRLCKETEWEFACEGEAMVPYPTGQSRESNKCNFDRVDLVDAQGKLRDYRKTVEETSQCVSPFGVQNMVGNVDEWVHRDRTNGEWRSAMKGGWWMPARNRCRPATTAHDEHYKGFQAGFRCCAD